MTKTKIATLLGIAIVMLTTGVSSALALSGNNADDVRVKVYTEQGDDWFKVFYTKTDDDGVLELKDVLPGKYKIVVKDSDQESGQTLAGKFKMLDENGVRVDEKTDVDVYMYISGVKTLILQTETDSDGWLDLASLTPEAEYYIKVKDTMHLKSKDDKYRIKVKTKIDKSKWFRSTYKRTDTEKVLELKNVPSAKYKFKYKAGDASLTTPFTLKLQMLDSNMKEIEEKTTVKLYAYVGKEKALIGKMKTDKEGWITVPGVMTATKYKISVK